MQCDTPAPICIKILGALTLWYIARHTEKRKQTTTNQTKHFVRCNNKA